MDWLVTDRHNQRWYPYVMTKLSGVHEVLMHHELDDTDMGDLEMDELVAWRGPLAVIPVQKNGSVPLPRPRPANYIEEGPSDG